MSTKTYRLIVCYEVSKTKNYIKRTHRPVSPLSFRFSFNGYRQSHRSGVVRTVFGTFAKFRRRRPTVNVVNTRRSAIQPDIIIIAAVVETPTNAADVAHIYTPVAASGGHTRNVRTSE